MNDALAPVDAEYEATRRHRGTEIEDSRTLQEANRSDPSPVSKLTAELQALGHPVGHRVVNELLHQLGYTLHPDRDANYLNERCAVLSSRVIRSFR